MKTKNIIIIILCLCIIAFVPGVTGAVSVYDENDILDTNNAEDLMVGMFVTTEYLDLFDMEGYLEDNIVNVTRIIHNNDEIDNIIDYEGKHYAKLVNKSFTDEETGNQIETSEYVFEDLDGYGCYSFFVDDRENGYYSSVIDDVFCDCSIVANGFDTLEENLIEATIYYSGEYAVFYVNPVYQSADGSVYVVPGQGIGTSGKNIAGSELSTSLKSETAVTVQDQAKNIKNEVKLTVKLVMPVEGITVSQMTKDNECIKLDSFVAGELPIDYYPESGAEYLIIDSVTTDANGNQQSDRDVIDKSEDSFDTYKTLENGMYQQFTTYVNW